MYLSALPVLWISNATESLRPPTLHDLPPSLTAAPTAAHQPSSRTGRCEQAPPAPHGPWRWRLRSKQGHVGLWCSDCSVCRGAQRIAFCGRLAPPCERSEALRGEGRGCVVPGRHSPSGWEWRTPFFVVVVLHVRHRLHSRWTVNALGGALSAEKTSHDRQLLPVVQCTSFCGLSVTRFCPTCGHVPSPPRANTHHPGR